MRRKKRLSSSLISVIVLVCLPTWLIYREVRREHLNNELITAIKASDASRALALLNADAPLQDVDSNGRSILWYAAAYHHDRVLRRLLASSVPANTADTYGTTPLMVADVEGARLLLEQGADVDATNKANETALFYADAAKADLLLRYGANVDAENTRGETALFYAIDGSNYRSLQALLEHGADVTVRDKNGNTALALAMQNSQNEMVALLKKYGAK